MFLKWLVLIFLCNAAGVSPLKILTIVSTSTKSHHIWVSSLTSELAKRGHEVLFVTSHDVDEKVTNLNVSILEPPSVEINKIGEEMIQSFRDRKSSLDQVHLYYRHNLGKCENHYDREPLKTMIQPQSGVKFDLILLDYGMEDCIFGLIYRFGYPPMILLSPLTYNAHSALRIMDTPIYAAYPHWFNLYPIPLSTWQRISTLFMVLYDDYLYYQQFLEENDRITRKYFGEDAPSIRELKKHVALLLVNQHSAEYRVPTGVNVIPVGGMHLKPALNLSSDLQEFLDGAYDGAILMSFGGRERADRVGVMGAEGIMATFARLPQRVIWKRNPTSSIDAKDVPANVMLLSWIPQNDVLGHPNLRLFISHCGGLSTQEATYHGVPVLAIPFLVDQLTNAASIEAKGAGLVLLPEEITQDKFYDSVNEIVNNPKYGEEARRLRDVMRTDVAPPLDRAVFWVEFVARFRGAPFMRSPLRDMPWPHMLLLDVVIATVVMLASTAGFLVTLVWIGCVLWRSASRKCSRDHKKKV